jgi:hypothetical protein
MSSIEPRTRIRVRQSTCAVLVSIIDRELETADELLHMKGMVGANMHRYRKELADLKSEVNRARAHMGWIDARG